jgi:hypothetical protein
VLPPITAYYVMRVGKLPLIPYYAPGRSDLADAVGRLAAKHSPCCSPITAGRGRLVAQRRGQRDRGTGGDARLYLLLHGHPTRYLTRSRWRT